MWVVKNIEINLGVKEGYPLCPLLFKLINDELLNRLKKKNISEQVEDELITAMEFTNNCIG